MFRPRFVVGLAVACLLTGTAASARQGKAAAKADEPSGPVIVLEFAGGTVEITTFPEEAPKSVEHVIDLVRRHFYRGQRIWWATPSLVQFGDPTTRDMTKRDVWGTVSSGRSVGVDESDLAKHKFVRGIVGLGYRQGYNPRTADSYLFIIKGSNTAANGKYAVIGQISDPKQMLIIDKLEVPDLIKNAYIKGEK
jgi:cyclophilin family peptidyl-prolyl cis-trans isomerase